MGIAHAAGIVLGKELRLEFRSRELLATTIVFVLLVLVLFSFSFDFSPAESRHYGPGLLWLALLFAGSLMLHPTFARELANDTLFGLRLAPVDPFAIVLGKTLANMTFLGVAEALLLPVFAALYNINLFSVFGRLVLVLGLGTLGLSVTGTVFSAVASQARMRELLLPLLLLPVLAPVLIAAVEATAGLVNDAPELSVTWVSVLVVFDAVFVVASWLLCEHLLEE